MTRYASQTSVSVEKSRAEIESILTRYGADQFVYGWSGDDVVIMFKMKGKMIRFNMTMPPKDQFKKTPSGRRMRSNGDMLKAWEQASRQRWRALALVIKAKLEAVESDIKGITFESEFLAHFVLAGNKTIGEILIPQLDTVIKKGKLMKLLPSGGKQGTVVDAEFEIEGGQDN